jgi:hypothetical protein
MCAVTHPSRPDSEPERRMASYRGPTRPIGLPPVQIPENHLNTTAFLCIEEPTAAGATPVPRATAFFVIDREGTPPYPTWVVTGRHCLEAARAEGRPMYLRVNTKDSFIDIPTQPDDWHESHGADIAVALWQGPPECRITSVPLDQFVSEDYHYHGRVEVPVMAQLGGQAVLVGHEVFFVGLFSQHAGRFRNLPIARSGMVSRLPLEPVRIERPDGGFAEIQGYLVEARSWGGHSGSPVFWYYPGVEVNFVTPPPAVLGANRAERRREKQPRQIPVSRETGVIALLGVVSAHFDIPQPAVTEGDVIGRIVTPLNAGIAVVTPAHEIMNLLQREDVMAERDKYAGSGDEEPVATYDVVRGEELATSGEGEERTKIDAEPEDALGALLRTRPKHRPAR